MIARVRFKVVSKVRLRFRSRIRVEVRLGVSVSVSVSVNVSLRFRLRLRVGVHCCGHIFAVSGMNCLRVRVFAIILS